MKNLQWKPVSKQEFVKYLKKKMLNKGKPKLRNRLSCFTILLVVYRYILKVKLLQLCSSIHGIFQARVLEWVAIFFSRGFSQPRDRTQISYIAGE